MRQTANGLQPRGHPQGLKGRYAKIRFEIEYDFEELQRQEGVVPASARSLPSADASFHFFALRAK